MIHPNLALRSNHSCDMMGKCPHKFYLYRMLDEGIVNTTFDIGDETDINLDFGHCLGIAIAEICVSNNLQKAYMTALRSWRRDLDDDEGERKRKTFWYLLLAVDKFYTYRNTTLARFDLVTFEGIPAVELGFRIDTGGGFYFRGKLDVLMRDKQTGRFVIIECKSTVNNSPNEAQYKFSSQGLGYSVVVDTIAAQLGVVSEQPFTLLYTVYSTPTREWFQFDFPKSHTARAEWIKDLLLDRRITELYAEASHWPRKPACYDFYRVCKYFDICDLDLDKMVPDESKVKKVVDREEDYRFNFHLDDLIDAQLAKHGVGKDEAE